MVCWGLVNENIDQNEPEIVLSVIKLLETLFISSLYDMFFDVVGLFVAY